MDSKLLTKLIDELSNSTKTERSKLEYLTNCLEMLGITIPDDPDLTGKEKTDYIYKIIISSIEERLTKDQLKEFYENLPFSLVQFIKYNEIKKKLAADVYTSEYANTDKDFSEAFISVISSIKEDTYKIKFYEQYKRRIDDIYGIRLLSTIQSDELKERYIPHFTDSEDIAELIQSLKNDNLKFFYLRDKKDVLDSNDKNRIIASFESDEIKMQFLNQVEMIPFIIVKSLKDSNNILRYWNKLNSKQQVRILKFITNEEIRVKLIISLMNSEHTEGLSSEIANLTSDLSKMELLETNKTNKGQNFKSVFSIIKSMKDESNILESLKRYGDAKTFMLVRTNHVLSTETILKNLDLFLKKETGSNDIGAASNTIHALYKSNTNIIHSLDFSFITKKYLSTLGADKVNLIASFPELEKQIMNLNDIEYEAFWRVIKYYSKNNNQLDWTYVAYQILNEFHYKECSELINSIRHFDNIRIDYLTRILLDGNQFGIKSVAELNNYEQLIRDKCNKQIKSNNIHEQINAIMVKLCGIGQDLSRSFHGHMRHNTWHLTKFYSEDIDLLEDNPYKSFVKKLKSIQEITDSEELRRIYDSITEFRYLDIFYVETELKKLYLKLYNAKLLHLIQTTKNEEGLYEAGTDFCIITTSVGAYNGHHPTNYKEDWNRASLTSQHFCTNFIRNDMLGMAPIPHIAYGFTNMHPDSLMLSEADDIYSSGTKFISKAFANEKYLAPDNLINQTYLKEDFKYNELDFRRIQNGIKKQPDYILVFRKDGVISNIEEAKKASKDWNGLPIVVIDIDLCLKSESKKMSRLFALYNKTKSTETLKHIYQKIVNNRITDSNFASEVNIDNLKALIEDPSLADKSN